MNTRYFRMKVPGCRPEEIKWIEMTGREFYHFIHSPEGQGRHFIDMGDVVLESPESEAHAYRTEQKHHQYIQDQEKGWSTLSLYTMEGEDGCNGEEVISADALDVEAEAIIRMERNALRVALTHLDKDSRLLIQALYLADVRKTEQEFAKQCGVSQAAIHKRKKKVLETVKFLVIKIQKSRQ